VARQKSDRTASSTHSLATRGGAAGSKICQ
jgi:hypothetical protein